MELFGFLRKKRKKDVLSVKSTSVENTDKKRNLYTSKQVNYDTYNDNENFSTIKMGKQISVKGMTIHEDLTYLIWIADGKYKNYTLNQEKDDLHNLNGFRIKVSFLNKDEPSLIYTHQSISKPNDINNVIRPSYFPTYSNLNPEQKWMYLNFLADPYNASFDIGFVFILYYGLERHLLSGNFEKAIDVILKLRDVHTNKSFQAYSANAIILSCMIHQRGDLVLKFINSLDKKHEFAFSDNLFLICYYSFDLHLLPKDIMRMAKTFEFSNQLYIKKHPDLFLEFLTDTLKNNTGEDFIDLKQYLTKKEIAQIKTQKVGIFANVSIMDNSVPIPLLSENFKLKKEMYDFLKISHDKVKIELARMKKSGIVTTEINLPPKKIKEINFDKKQENELLKELSKNKHDFAFRHFAYINLQNFYYKYRSLGEEYINKCVDYCLLDINSLDAMNKAYIDKEIKRIKEYEKLFKLKPEDGQIEKIKKQGFTGNISAFKRLVIIYEKEKKFEKAIDICNQAIEYGQSVDDFLERKEKILKKMAN